MMVNYPVKDLKSMLKHRVYASVTLWIDTEQNMHIRFDDEFFTIGVNLSKVYWVKKILHPSELADVIIKEYKDQLLKKFVKD